MGLCMMHRLGTERGQAALDTFDGEITHPLLLRIEQFSYVIVEHVIHLVCCVLLLLARGLD